MRAPTQAHGMIPSLGPRAEQSRHDAHPQRRPPPTAGGEPLTSPEHQPPSPPPSAPGGQVATHPACRPAIATPIRDDTPTPAQPRPLGPEMGPGGQVRQIQGGARRESLLADAVVRPLRWCSDNQIRTPPHHPRALRARPNRTVTLTQFGDPSRAALRLESLTPGSLLPSLRFGVTLSSLRVRYAPFGESPRVLPRSGSSLAQL